MYGLVWYMFGWGGGLSWVMDVRVVNEGGVVWDFLWVCIVSIRVCQGWVMGSSGMVYVSVRIWWRLFPCGGFCGVGSYVWVWGVVDFDWGVAVRWVWDACV